MLRMYPKHNTPQQRIKQGKQQRQACPQQKPDQGECADQLNHDRGSIKACPLAGSRHYRLISCDNP